MDPGVNASAPIGVFDSGVGGLTVARAIIDQLPGERVRYLGDTGHGPYGPLTARQARTYTLACLDELAGSGVKMLVIACNTAAAAGAYAEARSRYDVPVIEVINPAVRRAIAVTKTRQVGVLGTQVTVDSGAYPAAFAAADPSLRVQAVACPSFVDFVERGITSGRQVMGLAQAYLAPLQRTEVDTVVLGCTHYPLLAGVLQLTLGEGVTLVSSAEETAKQVLRQLTEADLLNEAGGPAEHEFGCTGDPDSFTRLGRRFLGPEITGVRHIG